MDEVRKQEALNAISKVLNDYSDVFGPRYCAIHERDTEACDCDPNGPNGIPIPDVLNTGWVLCSTWTGMDTGEGFFDWEANEGSLFTGNLGLVRSVLLDMESEFFSAR